MANNPKRIDRRVFPTAHSVLLNRLLRPILLNIHGEVLVVGSGKVDYRSLMPNASTLLCSDIEPGEYIDVVADAQDLPMEDSSFDAVIVIEVIEHLNNPHKAIEQMSRVLRPGGKLLLSIPFMFRVHGDPNDYQRLTASGLGVLLDRKFDSSIRPFGGRLSVISDIITTSTNILVPLRVFNHLFRLGLFQKTSHDCPTGYLVRAEKR
jgi:SAM-dependent methyltransferase